MPKTIDREGVLEFMASGVSVIDVLPPREHRELRIAGSLGIWLRELDLSSVEGVSKTDPVVVYCHDFL